MSTCLRLYSRYDEQGNEVNEPTSAEDILVGALTSLLSALCIILNAWFIKKSFGKGALCLNSAKLTVILAVSSIVQLTVHFVGGMLTVSQNVLHPAFSKTLGAALESFHLLYTLTIAVIALNRLIQIAFPVWDDRVFSSLAMKLWYGFLALASSAFLLLLCLPWATFRFRPEQWSWTYDYADKMSHSAQSLQANLEYSCVLFWGLVYVVVFAFIVREQNLLTVARDSTTEAKVLAHAVAVTSCCTIVNVIRNNCDVAIPATRVAYLVVNVLWILNCAVNPLAFFVHDLPVEGILKVICGKVFRKTNIPTTPSPTASVANMQATSRGNGWPRWQWKKRPATAVTGEAEGRSVSDLTPTTFQKHKEDQRVEQFSTNRKIVFLT